MIVSQGKYPFGTIITRMSDGDVQFVISTAKEGLLKGLTTCVQLPTGTTAAKIFYMPSMNKPAIHAIHSMLVDSIEENLKRGGHLAVILHDLLLSLRDSQYTQEVVIDCNLTDYVTSLRGDVEQPLEGKTAAEQGDADAQHALALCYFDGKGVEQDYAEAAKWWRKAAEQGHARAQHMLGICYKEGEGVEKNYTEAVKWWRKAAAQGSAGAQELLGLCYGGEGVEWYRLLAEQGYADFQIRLGLCYFEGKGVEKDYTEAMEWFRKAAEQGNAAAQKFLDAGAGG